MSALCKLALCTLAATAPGGASPSASPSAHPNSLSNSRIQVNGSEALLTLRCQALSLMEVVLGLDADLDGFVSAAELELRRDEVLAYVAVNYRLTVGSDREKQGGVELVAEPLDLLHYDGEVETALGFQAGAVDVSLRYTAEAPITDLLVEIGLFFETSPDHIDIAVIEWGDGEVEHFSMAAYAPSYRTDPTGRGAFRVYSELGVRHILGGWDHLAFLATLILCARGLRSLLGVVTAFTLAHSVTLALAALELVDTSRFDHLVESVIALSIAYVAADNLVQPDLKRGRWIEAFVFGLIHGLGFAGFLGESLLNEPAKVTALFAFNLGVEGGQLLVVVAIVLALLLVPRRMRDAEFLAPRRLRQVGSAAMLVAGLYWFAQRL